MHPDGLATVDPDLIRTLRNGLRIMALRALGDADAAEDVVQETLMRALDAVTPEVAADRNRLGAFVGGIARHVIADARRRAVRFQRHAHDGSVLAHDSDPLTRIVSAEEQALIRNAIQNLQEPDQLIVRASFFEGLTPAEIAERLNEPAERIRKRKSRALARLRDVLMRPRSHESLVEPSISQEDAAMAARGGR